MTLFDFSDSSLVAQWQAIDDRVMGGVSVSEVVAAQLADTRLAAFSGEVSLKNNGGFCSVRAPVDLSKANQLEHLWIRCSNNAQWGAKTYYLNVRIDGGFDGVSYRTAFTPGTTLTQFEFSIAEFRPVFRGRPVTDAPPLHLPAIRQMGLMIADSQTGPFELYLAAMGAS